MNKQILTGIIGFMLFGILSQAVSAMPLPDKDNVLQRYHKGYNLKINRFFIVKKTPIQVFENADDTNPMPQKKVRLGQIFFASQEAGSRLLLGQYQLIGNNPGWSEMLGWVDKANLLEDRIEPLTVGEAIKKGLNVKQSNEAGGLSPQNSLYLRIITQPERLVKPRNNPDDETGTGKAINNSFTWYYVYDVVKHQGKSWVLAGNAPRLASDDRFEDTVSVAGPEQVLLGWLPLKKMTIWASNFVLELNTSPEAVHYRVKNNKPAIVKAEPDERSQNLYVEPLSLLWPNGKENPAFQDSVRLDPYGLSPDFPRRMVVQAWPGWIEVASAASIKKDGIKESTILEIKRSLRKTIRDLQQVDLTLKVAEGLKKALKTIDADLGFLDSAKPTAKKLLIGKIVLIVRDYMIGENKYACKSGQEKLKKDAELLLSQIQFNDKLADTSLGRVLLIPDSLPFREDSFMSMSLAKVLDQEKSWFLQQVDKLNLEATGLDRLLNNGLEKFQKLTNIVYYQGYVPLNEIEFSRLDANQTGKGHPKSYRLRVMLRVGELTDLRDITKKVAGELKTALTTLGMNDDPLADFLDSAEPKAKKLLICEIVLLVRDYMTGENKYVGKSGQKKLKQAAEKLLSRIQSGKLAGTSLGRVLLIPDSLPFRVDSFMSVSLAKVLDQEKPWFLKQVEKLNLKATGLDRILNNGVVPEDFNAIGTAPANIGKRWRFSNSLTSTISYIYVPIGYIP